MILHSDDGFGSGDDSITVGGGASGTSDINGSTRINMYGGNDTITVEDDIKGKTVIHTGDGDDTIIVGDDIREKAEIDTGSGNDTITVSGDFSSSNSIETDAGDDTITIGGKVSGEIHMGSGDDYLSIGGVISDTVDGGSSGTDYLYLASYSYDDYTNNVDKIRSEYIEDFEYIMFSDGTVYDVDDDKITEDETVLSIFENGSTTIPASDYYTITGTATGGAISEGDTVTLEINGTIYTTVVALSGAWSVDVDGADLDADNEFDAVVSSSDASGNTVETKTTYIYSATTDSTDDIPSDFEDAAENLNDNVAWFESNTGIEDDTVDYVNQNDKYWNDDERGSHIIGTGNNDIIYGNGGDDHIVGSNSQDKLYGGEDRDWLEGGDGDDKLYGDNGDDLLNGGTGQDELISLLVV